jgi:predicted secreted Zn-dependent protease
MNRRRPCRHHNPETRIRDGEKRMFWKSVALVFLSMLLVPPAAQARKQGDLTVRVTVKYYDIHGQTARQLRRQMKILGPPFPPVKGKGPYWGYTRGYPKKLPGCRYRVTIIYTMPRWVDRAKASAGLQRRWDHMVDRLLKHERGHGKIAISTAKQHLNAKCKNKEEIKERRRVRDKTYDFITRHGALTGVFLF